MEKLQLSQENSSVAELSTFGESFFLLHYDFSLHFAIFWLKKLVVLIVDILEYTSRIPVLRTDHFLDFSYLAGDTSYHYQVIMTQPFLFALKPTVVAGIVPKYMKYNIISNIKSSIERAH